MAKKVVATLKTKDSGPGVAKIIRAIKNDKGFYSFKTEIVPADKVQEFISGKQK
jgi:hypothetical protein